MVAQEHGLLEHIAERAGLLYLSDLHDRSSTVRMMDVIAALPSSEYTAEEWSRAMDYITGAAASPEELAKGTRYLKEKLLERIEQK